MKFEFIWGCKTHEIEASSEEEAAQQALRWQALRYVSVSGPTRKWFRACQYQKWPDDYKGDANGVIGEPLPPPPPPWECEGCGQNDRSLKYSRTHCQDCCLGKDFKWWKS